MGIENCSGQSRIRKWPAINLRVRWLMKTGRRDSWVKGWALDDRRNRRLVKRGPTKLTEESVVNDVEECSSAGRWSEVRVERRMKTWWVQMISGVRWVQNHHVVEVEDDLQSWLVFWPRTPVDSHMSWEEQRPTGPATRGSSVCWKQRYAESKKWRHEADQDSIRTERS